jgi:FtsP/CotA-like multicopper oxidase with cupredoxin domain
MTLDFTETSLETESVKFRGRGYNNIRPGPTWRIKAGDQVTVHFNNKLSGKDNYADHVHNDYYKPNTTNLHTHGVHVSASGQSDDVLV